MKNEKINELYLKCVEAMKLSYSPYSNFPVGAVILLQNGEYVLGANIENAAYPSSMCAERVALYSTYSKGFKKKDIVALGIIGNTEEPIAPCGACRQVISELMNSDCDIILFNSKGDYKETNIKELLPYSFDEKDL